MIARVWRGAGRSSVSDAYSAYMHKTGVPSYAHRRLVATRHNSTRKALALLGGDREGEGDPGAALGPVLGPDAPALCFD